MYIYKYIYIYVHVSTYICTYMYGFMMGILFTSIPSPPLCPHKHRGLPDPHPQIRIHNHPLPRFRVMWLARADVCVRNLVRHKCMCMCVYIYICACIYVYICIYMYIYTSLKYCCRILANVCGCRRRYKRLTLFVLRTKAVALVLFARRSARPPALPPRGRLPPQSVSPPRGCLTSHSPRGRLTSHSPRGSHIIIIGPCQVEPGIVLDLVVPQREGVNQDCAFVAQHHCAIARPPHDIPNLI